MLGTYRGRLIFPFTADLRQLDTSGTGAAKGGDGYDPIFREPSPVAPSSGEGGGVSPRAEKGALLLPCQVEMGNSEKLRQFFAGNDPTSRLVLVFHFCDLEKRGLVDARGNPTLAVGDRLESLSSTKDGKAVWTPPTQPVYCIEAQPNAFGIGNGRNLLFMFFEARDNAASL